MSIYSNISVNKNKTWLIIILFIFFITILSYIFGKASGYGLSMVGVAFIFSGIMSFSSYFYSDKLILSMSHAKTISKSQYPQLYRIVENLCIGSGTLMPKLYIINDTAPNAFATGRDPQHAVMCITSGLLEKLNKSELEGVIAHELSHIKNYDIRVMSIVVVLVGLITLLTDFFMRSLWYRNSDDNKNSSTIFIVIGIALAIISPIIATLIQLAVSRKRELLADASAALLTRYPEGLASALEKIGKDREPLEVANNATAHLFIANPFKGKGVNTWVSGLFNTHPPIEERIKLLRSM
ncbi:MAG: M48 family metallopeptidase [Candidatus Levybacteria bacterium]|nr:M48 family metallopeptidase [Candidatus Levybacteria bacterium]